MNRAETICRAFYGLTGNIPRTEPCPLNEWHPSELPDDPVYVFSDEDPSGPRFRTNHILSHENRLRSARTVNPA